MAKQRYLQSLSMSARRMSLSFGEMAVKQILSSLCCLKQCCAQDTFDDRNYAFFFFCFGKRQAKFVFKILLSLPFNNKDCHLEQFMCLFDSPDLFSQDFPTPLSGGRKEKEKRERVSILDSSAPSCGISSSVSTTAWSVALGLILSLNNCAYMMLGDFCRSD